MPKALAVNLSESIRGIRAALGLTLRNFSHHTGIRQTTLRRCETTTTEPDFGVLLRIFNAAPPGDCKEALRGHLVSICRQGCGQHPELADGCFDHLVRQDGIMASFPDSKSRRRTAQLTRFADLVARVAEGPLLDDSISSFLEHWAECGFTETAGMFQDASDYISIRLNLSMAADWDGEPENVKSTLDAARDARRLASSLLRRAAAAEREIQRSKPAPTASDSRRS